METTMTIFKREDVVIGKTKTSKRKVFGGYGGYTETEISIPSWIAPEQWRLLKADHRSVVTVAAPVAWVDGKAPIKADRVWSVSVGSPFVYGKIIAVGKTYKEAMSTAIDWVYSANPTDEGEA
jgi:hypothetical protein